MRNAVNNNPLVQIGLIAGLGLLVAVMFMSRMGGSSSSATEETASEPATTESTASPATPSATTPSAPETSTTPASEPVVPSAPSGAEFEASKGLPQEFVDSYRAAEIPVLIVLDQEGLEDRGLIRQAVLAEYPTRTALFFAETGNGTELKFGDEARLMAATASNNKLESLPIGRYSRIAEGVALDRTPAIIVLQPLKKSLEKGESAPMPAASVSYGFRGPESISQAINDALYRGESKSYAP